MVAKWILSMVCVLVVTHAQAQFRHQPPSRGHLEGLNFIQDAGNLTRVSQTCGIYNTSHDLQSGTLSVAIDCLSENHRIQSGFIGDKSAIKVVRDEKTYRYRSNDIHGYRDCSGMEYHFFDGKRYQLINPGEDIPIYRTYQWIGKHRVAKHFFRRPSGAVKPLTLENLNAEFSEEPMFLEKLSQLAKNDFQLIRYMHALNRLRMNTFPENPNPQPAFGPEETTTR